MNLSRSLAVVFALCAAGVWISDSAEAGPTQRAAGASGGVSISGSVTTIPGDSAANDPFSRTRVALPELRISALFDEADRVLYWTSGVAGGGAAAYDSDSGAMLLSVGTASGDSVIRQTKEHFAYKAGQGQLALLTFMLAAQQANLTQRVGYGNDAEGIYLQVADTGEPEFCVKSISTGATVTDCVSQSSWDVDPLDGTGPSGFTLDLTKTQILVIDFQWLGVGRVRLGFDLDGVIVYAHHFKHANIESAPYIKSPKQPLRYEIVNTGVTASPSEMMQICSTLIREGGTSEPGVVRSVYSAPDASETSTTTLRTVLGIRLQAAHIHDTLQAVQWHLSNIDTEVMLWTLILNPGGTGGASWANVPGGDSIAQYSRSQINVPVDAAGLPTATSGVVLASGTLTGAQQSRGESATQSHDETVPVAASYTGTPDELWIAVRQVTGSGTVIATLDYKEIR